MNDKVIAIGDHVARTGNLNDEMREDVCEHCAFSHFKPASPQGDCRANPPTPLIVPQQNPITGQMGIAIQSLFPPVERRTFCYTYEPRVDEIEPH